uniref:Uncharacterized protein n=1 Tax=Panagrolaimus sp. PS1159 TaxID=55785 RepID=A0AC35GNI8_9BILA
MLGSYDWDVVKAKIDELVTEELVYSNTKYFDKITPTLISEQDFIIIQNPTKPQLELIQSSGNKAVIMLLGICGVPAPQLPNTAPTATIKIVMESPFLIDQIVTSLPDPVANASIYLPGAPAGDKIQKTRFLSSVAMEKGCSLAGTMTLENSHHIADLVETKTKAAFCFVTEKVARHFMSNCANFEGISVVGDASLREIVRSVAGPPPKKRKTNDNEVD